MYDLPQILCLVDIQRETTALHEANILDIPVLAMVDTNCDPSGVDRLIASNDDAIRAIKLIIGCMADAVLEGRALRKDDDLPGDIVDEKDYTPHSEAASDEDLLGAATLAKLSSGELDFGDQPQLNTDIVKNTAVEEAKVEDSVADPDPTEEDGVLSIDEQVDKEDAKVDTAEEDLADTDDDSPTEISTEP